MASQNNPERLIKSIERVRDLGEVFTPFPIIQDMLNLLPNKMWQAHPSLTFLEPACGDGNFLVAILDKKLTAVLDEISHNSQADQFDNARFFALEALSSIYGVDISSDNVIGGTPGHEIGARDRLLDIFREWHGQYLDEKLESDDPILLSAQWIVHNNIQVADMLEFSNNNKPKSRKKLVLIEYQWQLEKKEVSVSKTTLSAVMEEAKTEISNNSLQFGPIEPIHLWTGPVQDLHLAPSTHSYKKNSPKNLHD